MPNWIQPIYICNELMYLAESWAQCTNIVSKNYRSTHKELFKYFFHTIICCNVVIKMDTSIHVLITQTLHDVLICNQEFTTLHHISINYDSRAWVTRFRWPHKNTTTQNTEVKPKNVIKKDAASYVTGQNKWHPRDSYDIYLYFKNLYRSHLSLSVKNTTHLRHPINSPSLELCAAVASTTRVSKRLLPCRWNRASKKNRSSRYFFNRQSGKPIAARVPPPLRSATGSLTWLTAQTCPARSMGCRRALHAPLVRQEGWMTTVDWSQGQSARRVEGITGWV